MPMTSAGYRDIHRYMLQDVYDWAGKDRTVDMWKTGIAFARPGYIDRSLDACFAALNEESNLRGLDARNFASRAAVHCGDLNSVHPFRDGNGRTLRAFLERLSDQAGHGIDLQRIEPALWNHASRNSHEEYDNALLTSAITGAMTSLGKGSEVDRTEPEVNDDIEP